MPKTVLVLVNHEGAPLCVCSSEKQLKKAVDHWMDEHPLSSLCSIEYELNYIIEPICMGWCYVAPVKTNFTGPAYGGWKVPKHLWGINLVGMDLKKEWESASEEEYQNLIKEKL